MSCILISERAKHMISATFYLFPKVDATKSIESGEDDFCLVQSFPHLISGRALHRIFHGLLVINVVLIPTPHQLLSATDSTENILWMNIEVDECKINVFGDVLVYISSLYSSLILFSSVACILSVAVKTFAESVEIFNETIDTISWLMLSQLVNVESMENWEVFWVSKNPHSVETTASELGLLMFKSKPSSS